MKLKINWKEMLKAVAKAIVPFLVGAMGGIACGCSTMSTTPRGQTTEIVALGIPAVAWISHTNQDANHGGSDTNAVTQANDTVVEAK